MAFITFVKCIYVMRRVQIVFVPKYYFWQNSYYETFDDQLIHPWNVPAVFCKLIVQLLI